MTSYFDSSVIVSSILDETKSTEARSLITGADIRMTSPLSLLETRRAIKFAHESTEPKRVRRNWNNMMNTFFFVGGSNDMWHRAADIADLTGVKSLDAIHLAAAAFLKVEGLQFVTFDRKQALAARSLGLTVVGA